MEPVRISLSRCIAFSLYSSDVEQDWTVDILGVLEQTGEPAHIVAVHRSQIGEAHLLEHTAREKGALDGCLELVGEPVDMPSAGQLPHQLPVALFKAQVLRLEPLAGQVLGHAAHVFRDGHAVVVEDHDEGLLAVPGVGEALIGQASRERAVADEGQDVVLLPHLRPGVGHAHRHRHGVGGMARDERVMDALRRLGKAGQPAKGAQGFHRLPASGQHLVDIALVPHIEEDAVPAGVKDPVDGHRDLHRTQVGPQMPSGL